MASLGPVKQSAAGTSAPALCEAFATGREASESCEGCVAFSAAHYPRGLNANFLLGDESTIVKEHIKKFEDADKRDIAKAASAVMDMLKTSASLSKSSVVADIGAGTGLFLERLSAAAKSVLAMEISPHFLAYLRKQVKVRRLQNVIVTAGTAHDPSLPKDSVDVALVCDVYHHFEYPRTVCSHLFKALRPGGRLVVIDYIRDEAVHKSHPPGWIYEHIRAGQEVFRSEIESVGFKHVCEPSIPSLAENYCMIFERPV